MVLIYEVNGHTYSVECVTFGSLESYPARLEAVKKAGGGHTKY